MAKQKVTTPNILSKIRPSADAAINSALLSSVNPALGMAYNIYRGAKALDQMGVGGSGNPAGAGGDLQNKKMRPKKNRVSAATGGKVSYKSIFEME